MRAPSFLTVDPEMLKTEERIIVAAMKVFADYPLEQATLRQIAKEGKISFSSITYYFKTKENLYQEVVNRILGVVIPSWMEAMPEPPSRPEEARVMLRRMIEGMADFIYGNSHITIFAKIIFREHFSPSFVYDQIYEAFFRKVLDRYATLVRCLRQDWDQRRSEFQALSITGQIVTFRLQREILVRTFDYTGYSEAEIAELKNILVENIFSQLGAEP